MKKFQLKLFIFFVFFFYKMSKMVQLCCDVNSKFSVDIIVLLTECKTFLQLQSVYESYEEQLRSLINDLERKINELPAKKCKNVPQNSLITAKINEFIYLVWQIWETAKEHLERRSSTLKYLTKEGIPVIAYMHRLITFAEYIHSNFYHSFVHPQCSSTFIHLTNQLKDVIYPELSFADSLEQNLADQRWSVQFLNNLLAMIDRYTISKKADIVSFYHQLTTTETNRSEFKINKVFLPWLLLSSSLKGEMFEERIKNVRPAVEDSKFYEILKNMTQYLLEMTPLNERVNKSCTVTLRGCLNTPYWKQLFIPASYSYRGSGRGRGRLPRGTAYFGRSMNDRERTDKSDLIPIRLPSLERTFLPIE